MTNAPAPRKYRRKTWIVNPYLQYRLIALWGSSMILIFGLLYMGIAKTFSNIMSFISLNVPEHNKELIAFLEEQNSVVASYVLLAFTLFVILFFYVQLKETNRIAGPIFNLIRKMKLFSEQGQIELVQFRKDDYFKELSEEYNAVIARVQSEKQMGKENE